jgi:tetratricopeptide (TPR) repeat protein
VGAYWFGEGLRYLRESPGRALALAGRKAIYWCGNQEISTEYLLPTERRLLPLLWLAPLPFGILLALAIAGARAAGRAQARHVLLYLLILANLATVIAFFFSSRLRLPAVPFVCVLAGAGLSAIAARAGGRGRRAGLAVWLLPSCAVLLASLLPPAGPYRVASANQHFNIGVVHYEAARYEAAAASYSEALRDLDWKWEVHYNLGQAYRRMGRWEEAAVEFQRVVDREPGHPRARRHLEEAIAKCRR